MAVEHLQSPTGPPRLASGLLRLTLRGEFPPAIRPGDRFVVRGFLDRVRPAGTPGAFDYRQHLANQGIWIIGRVRSPANIQKVFSIAPPTLAWHFSYQPERWRHRLVTFIRTRLPPATASLYTAILFGDPSGIAATQLENYKAAGCLHLLAISGLNIAILAMVITFSLTWLLARSTWITLHLPLRKIAVAAAILPLTAYSCLAGLHYPVLRALLMAGAFMTALLLDRQWSIVANLALAALLILIWQPTALYTVSFQLTFAAVLAIAVVAPRLRPWLDPDPPPTAATTAPGIRAWLRRQLLAGLLLAIAATLGTLPLLLFYFNRFSPYSAFSTLLVEPLLCFWAMVIGLLACLFIPLAPNFASQLLAAGGWGISLADRLTAFFAALPASSLWFPTPNPLEIAASFCLLHGWASSARRPTRNNLFLAGIVLALAALFLHLQRTKNEESKITILDLGQGNGTVLQLRGGHTILVDGGGFDSPRFNVGERIIAPYLWRQKISRLEQVVISHPHADHYNGLAFVLQRFRPRELWINGQAGDPRYRELLALAARLGIAIKVPTPGSTLWQDEKNRLFCLDAPTDLAESRPPPGPENTESNGNNRSLLLRLECGQISLLLPGDLEEARERQMVAKLGRELQADILLAPHHGSKSSSSPEFLQAVAPRYVAISAGPFHSPRFPDPELLNNYRRLGAEVRQTALDGSIFFTTDGKTLRVATHLGREKRSAGEPGTAEEKERELETTAPRLTPTGH